MIITLKTDLQASNCHLFKGVTPWSVFSLSSQAVTQTNVLRNIALQNSHFLYPWLYQAPEPVATKTQDLPRSYEISSIELSRQGGGVAQLVRVLDCRSSGCGFESRRPRFFKPLPAKLSAAYFFHFGVIEQAQSHQTVNRSFFIAHPRCTLVQT